MKNQSTSASFDNNCCICHNTLNEEFYSKIDDYILRKCKECELVFLKMIQESCSDFIDSASEDLAKFSKEKVEYWSFPELFLKHNAIFNNYFSKRLKRIEASFPAIKEMLDIGTGFGFWMNYCFEHDIKIDGIEIVKECVDYSNDVLGLDVKQVSIESFAPEKKYDFITLCDVLEHLLKPDEVIGHISQKLLNDRGGLYIQVPDVLGLKIPYGHGLGLPYHYWQFNLESLRKLLEKNGFKVVKYWTGVSGVIGAYENGEVSLVKKMIWKSASVFKIGNRLQVLAVKI